MKKAYLDPRWGNESERLQWEACIILNKEYFRERFERIISEFCDLFPPDYQVHGEKEKFLDDLMKCFEEED